MNKSQYINITSKGKEENVMKIINKKSIKITEFNVSNKIWKIPRNGDIFDLKSIQFRNVSDNFKFNNITIITNGIERIRLGNTMMNILYETADDVYKNDEYKTETFIDSGKNITFNIPWENLGYDNILNLYCIIYNNVSLKINYTGNCDSCIVLGYYTYLDGNERKEIFHINHSKIVFQLFKQKCIQETEEKIHSLHFKGLINGLFFIDLDYNNILNLKILLDKNDFLVLNKYTITTFIRKISPNKFYLPLDCNPNFNNVDINNAVNFSAIDNISLQLKLQTNNPTTFYIGSKVPNIFEINRGLSEFLLTYKNNTNLCID